MTVDPLSLTPFLAWLSCGLAAVALSPRNGAARALLAAGAFLSAAWLLERVALDGTADDAAGFLLNLSADGLFLLKTPAIVAVLLLVPHGVFERTWHRVMVLAMFGAAAVVPLLRLMGTARVDVGNESATAVDNPVAIASLAPLGALGDAVLLSEPLWFLAGVAALTGRWFSDRDNRAELTRVLLGIGVVALLLALGVMGGLSGLPDLVPQSLFLVALAVLPVVLLLQISRRSRLMQGELTESRARLVTAEDQARRALERDLHDGVQQQLVGILTLTELAARHVGRPAQVTATLEEIKCEVETAITGLRELVQGVRPPALSDGGVLAALSDRFDRVSAVVLLEGGEVGSSRWPPEVEAAAYFVACEAVTNAVKHAPGAAITVSLTTPDGRLRVEVSDTGPGVDGRPRGSGLRGLQDRVESLGGRFEVVSSAAGTVVRAELPEELP